MGKGIFITGSDTEVGKTLCACGLIEALKDVGLDVGVYKPVLSGATENSGESIPEDALMLKSASRNDDDIDLVNPYCFTAPVTPAHAALLEGKRVEKEVLLDNYAEISGRHDITVVEGAGGLMVPIADDYLILDLIKDLNLSTIVVTDTALGRINHTLMTLEVLKLRGIDVIGVIVNRYPKRPKEKEISLLKYIKMFGDTKILGTVDEVKNIKSLYSKFITSFKDNVDISEIKEMVYEYEKNKRACL